MPGPEFFLSIRTRIVQTVDILFAASQTLQAFIDGDARKPSRKPRFFFESLEIQIGLEESALRGVLGLRHIAGDAQQHAVDAALVPLHQFFKRCGVPGTSQFDKLSIGVHGRRSQNSNVPCRIRR